MKGILVELVTGRLVSFFDTLAAQTSLNLAEDLQHFLRHDQWAVVDQDLRYAKAAIRAGLEVKFDWTKRLPWVLAGLASEDEDQARVFGSSAVAFSIRRRHSCWHSAMQYPKNVSNPAADCENNWTDFSLAILLARCPQLYQETCAFALVPIAERYIEGGHAAIKKKSDTPPMDGAAAVS